MSGYRLGGALFSDDPNYVIRDADDELYKNLKAGNFCYVLTSRQMGKSSLAIRTIDRLKAEHLVIVWIDLSAIDTEVTQKEWYEDIVFRITDYFPTLNREIWWSKHKSLTPIVLLGELEKALLSLVSQDIVIFFDEIDSVLSLNFSTDDFFAYIRSSYNYRPVSQKENNLSYCLLGVATPSSLIQDKNRTPFNIGIEIKLNLFTLEQAEVLKSGFEHKVENYKKVLEDIFKWTNGQPYLTLYLCNLISKYTDNKNPNIDNIVQEYFIDNLENLDAKKHLEPIRDRILIYQYFKNEQDKREEEELTRLLLRMYETILKKGEIEVDGSFEQSKLLLSGLVINHKKKLIVANSIYTIIFDTSWINRELNKLCPYNHAITVWLESDEQDESTLLKGQELLQALKFAEDKKLSPLDRRFLTASQNLEWKSQYNFLKLKNKKNRYKLSLFIVFVALVPILILWIKQNSLLTQHKNLLEQHSNYLSETSEVLSHSNPHKALLSAMRAGKALLSPKVKVSNQTQQRNEKALRWSIYQIREKNQLSGHKSWLSTVSFSPDGQKIATASADKTVKLWNLDGQLIHTLKEHQEAVMSVNFSPDGQKIATASADKTVKLWNLDGQLIHTLKGHNDRVNCVIFSPDGQIIATASTDNTIKFWRVSDGQIIKTLRGHNDDIDTIAFSPDGQMLASGSWDNTVKLWRVSDGQEIKTLRGHKQSIYEVTFSPNGQLIASTSEDHTVKLWNLEGKEINTFHHNSWVFSVTFSPRVDTQVLATASNDGTVKIWSIDGHLIDTLYGHEKRVVSVNFSPDGQLLASASWDGTVKLWQSDWQLLPLTQHDDKIFGVSVSPNGKWIATASGDQTVRIFDDRQLKTNLIGHKGDVFSVSFSPDNQLIVTSSLDKTIKLWNLEGKELKTFTGHTDKIWGVTFSPDGKKIASASTDNTAKIWDLQGKELLTLKNHSDIVSSVVFSPDGQLIITSSWDKTAKIWDLQGKELNELPHEDPVVFVTFSPDGKMIATASWDSTLKLWNREGELIKTIAGHEAPITSIAFSPDGQLIATSSEDETIKIWNLEGQELDTLTAHSDRIQSVSFSPKSYVIVSGSFDNSAIIWKLDENRLNQSAKLWEQNLDGLMVSACNWMEDYLNNNHTVEQRDKYLCD